MNRLYYGDCLTIMRERMAPASVDLIYLDPPFNSKRDYNAIYKDETGRPLPDQVEAFTDTWTLDAERMRIIKSLPVILSSHGIDAEGADFLAGFINGLVKQHAEMAAYLAYMTERLLWMRRVMKPSASIYLHCDPTASHYLKVVMDVVFGRKNFRNEVIWCYHAGGASKRYFPRKHDVLLVYGYDAKLSLHNILRLEPYRDIYAYNKSGKVNPGYHPDGKMLHDWWEVPQMSSVSKERLGYPTQKPLKLLDRIIRASSNPGDVVFDPFCGCATTIEAASKLGRQWIGIDITIHAIKRVARRRLQERLHLAQGIDYVIDGLPRTWEGAHELWRQDPYQFQKWCVEQVEGFVTVKRTADEGIDGRVYFDMPGEKVLQSMAVEVKGGENVGIKDVRSLNSVLQYENIQMAGLITLMEPGGQAEQEFYGGDGAGGTFACWGAGVSADADADCAGALRWETVRYAAAGREERDALRFGFVLAWTASISARQNAVSHRGR